MRFKFLIIPSLLFIQLAGAQTGSAPVTPAKGPDVAAVADASSTPASPPVSTTTEAAPAIPASTLMAIMDYKSVYEAATVEEEVKMAAERFSLTPSQQEVWLTAATDRRGTEKFVREKLESKNGSYEKEGLYRGLKSSHNTFYETITGYLSPVQKQAMEDDRVIQAERQRRLAKLPPPAPPVVAPAPVDSTLIKEAAAKEAEKTKAAGKKSKKKKKG